MKQFLLPVFTLLLLFTACNEKGKQVDQTSDSASEADTTITDSVPADSTIYGTSDEFGMSTFTLISDKGDTLYVTRTASDGTDGRIYGSLREGERYAMTIRDGGEAIGVLINLTELEKHVKDYSITNGHLLVKGDTVEILTLSDKEFKTK